MVFKATFVTIPVRMAKAPDPLFPTRLEHDSMTKSKRKIDKRIVFDTWQIGLFIVFHTTTIFCNSLSPRLATFFPTPLELVLILRTIKID